jgi:hypothetical protein
MVKLSVFETRRRFVQSSILEDLNCIEPKLGQFSAIKAMLRGLYTSEMEELFRLTTFARNATNSLADVHPTPKKEDS